MDHPQVCVLGQIEYGGWYKPDTFWSNGFEPKASVTIAVRKPTSDILRMFEEWLSTNLLGEYCIEDYRLNTVWRVYFNDLEDVALFFLRFKNIGLL